MNNFLCLFISVLIPLVVGGVSGFFTATGVDGWYSSINKPSWNPPNWIFGPVWTTLYVMMGVALYIVWKSAASATARRNAFILFGMQLLLNFFWSVVFFRLQSPGWALIEIIFLWIAILATIFSFATINKVAAWLLVPYISWVSFAMILNFTIWRLN